MFQFVAEVEVVVGYRTCCILSYFVWLCCIVMELLLSLYWWSYQLGWVRYNCAIVRRHSGFVWKTLVQVSSSSMTAPGFVALLAFYASPVTHNKMLRDVFRWLYGVFLGGIHVPADNEFE